VTELPIRLAFVHTSSSTVDRPSGRLSKIYIVFQDDSLADRNRVYAFRAAAFSGRADEDEPALGLAVPDLALLFRGETERVAGFQRHVVAVDCHGRFALDEDVHLFLAVLGMVVWFASPARVTLQYRDAQVRTVQFVAQEVESAPDGVDVVVSCFRCALLNARQRRGRVDCLRSHSVRGEFLTSEVAVAATHGGC